MSVSDTTAGVELDRLIARKVMQRSFMFVDGVDAERAQRERNAIPPYSTDIAAAFEMEAEIGRRGLRSKYARELVIETQGDDTIHCVWALIHATPLQRCTAALRAVEALEKK
jgi:hypothetical protein